MSDVTRILDAASHGDSQAAGELLPLVYDELRKLAAARMAAEAPGDSLDATALVHEAYLRLVGPTERPDWQCRGQFFAAAAEAMRRILVERARRRGREKHGGGRTRVDLEAAAPAAPEAADEVLAVDDALERLRDADPQAADLVKLRYFAGLSIPDAAAALNVSPRTADRLWAYARAWLRQAIEGS
jgi:RNA polymerase sigma factor (TIGR02999 family)